MRGIRDFTCTSRPPLHRGSNQVERWFATLTQKYIRRSTQLPLSVWFLAKTGISSLALMRQLGVSHPTAWLLHQKINGAMAAQDATHRLGGTVQLDDAYLGGERSGGKAGRGSENKVPRSPLPSRSTSRATRST